MGTQPVATRLPDDVANHIEELVESPVTEFDTRAAVVRSLVVSQFDE